MTIKALKDIYKDYQHGPGEHNSFVVYDFGGVYGKVLIVVTISGRYKDVVQVIRIKDGKEILGRGRCRPCDNLYEDAIDVAYDMMTDGDAVNI